MVDEYKQVLGDDVDLSLLDGMNPYDLFLKKEANQKFGPKLTNALADARSEGISQNQYETVSKMLAKGMDWQLIEEVTSVDEARYRDLARKVANGTNAASD